MLLKHKRGGPWNSRAIEQKGTSKRKSQRKRRKPKKKRRYCLNKIQPGDRRRERDYEKRKTRRRARTRLQESNRESGVATKDAEGGSG